MRFEELLALLPECPGPSALPLTGSTAFDYVVGGPEFYVSPTLAPRVDVENPAAPSVLLISAPGAVGKSTLAAVLAARKRAPRWDLSSDGPVGAHSLSGRLIHSFGFVGAASVHTALSNGQFFVVIDALDEARVKTTEDAFFSFLRDVATLAQGASPAPRFVLLGRTQITETAWLVLDDAGVSCAVHTVEPFDEEDALLFVDERVRTFRKAPGERAVGEHTRPYRDARDAVLARLREAITEQPNVEEQEVRAFLGYAPVLDAVATLLAATTNFEKLRESFTSIHGLGAHRTRPVAILASIVERILKREQEEKLVKNIKPGLEQQALGRGIPLNGNVLNGLYSAAEQSARLVTHVLGLHERFPTELQGPLAEVYEGHVAAFLPEHPFLREGRPANTVFESYLFSRALLEDDPVRREAVARYLEADEYKPSSLLARFYFSGADSTDNENVHVVPEHVGILYDSLRAGETDMLRVRLSIDGGDPYELLPDGERVEADLDFEYLPHGEATARPIRPGLVSAISGDSFFRFVRSVRNVNVVVPCEVSLGSGGKEVLLGPSVFIECAKLRISAERVTVAGAGRTSTEDRTDTRVVLRAGEYRGDLSRRPIVHGHLEVAWTGADIYPWTEYAVPEPARRLPEGPLNEVYRRFRRIALTLRSHKKGALARYRGKVEHQRILKGAIGDALLGQMVQDRVLELVENFYYWNGERANELVGVTWLDIRNWATGERLEVYLNKFVDANRELFG